MINASILKEIDNFPGRISIKNAADLTLSRVKSALSTSLTEYGVHYRISQDQVQSGNLFKKTYEDCLCITNPEHSNDYFSYCIRLSKTGNVAFITVQYYGESLLTGKKNTEEARKNSGSLAKMALGAILKTDQQAYDAEYQYYEIVDSAIKETFGI